MENTILENLDNNELIELMSIMEGMNEELDNVEVEDE